MASNFTPMLGASFKIDWMLFKMNPSGYSLHSIISLLAAAAAFYLFLRLYMDWKPACVGVLLFLFIPITFTVTSWFSTRHYLEGLFWALLSLYFFVRSDRRGSPSLWAGLFYLLASLNKEVYVVLPAVAFFISRGGFFEGLKRTSPLWLAMAVYAIWRVWIMGGIGGYPSNQLIISGEVLPHIPRAVELFSFHWFGGYHIMYFILVFFLVLSLRERKMIFILLILFLPLLPVVNIIKEGHYYGRYFLHISVFLTGALCLFVNRAILKGGRLLKGSVFLLVLIILSLSVRQDILLMNRIGIERLEAQETARAFIQSGQKFMRPEQPSWFYEGLRMIERDFFGREITTLIVPPDRFLKYADLHRLEEIGKAGIDIPYNEIARWKEEFREGPLTIRMNLNNYRLTWIFGPEKDGVYRVLRGPVSGLYYNHSDLRSEGSFMFGKRKRGTDLEEVYIRILYRTGGGEEIVSPEFLLEIPGNRTILYEEMR
jgi:hypothetical protein